MSDLMALSGPEHPPASGADPQQLVILLHGLGADGSDLIALAPFIAQVLPNAHIIAPDAPFPCDMAPYGRQWFSLQNRDPQVVAAGVAMAAPILSDFIQSQMHRFGIGPENTVLVGFSQGTMMSLYVAPRMADEIAAIIGFSGRLIGGADLTAAETSKPPILLIHGDADEIVPVEETVTAGAALQDAGFSVQTLICAGVPHSIDQAGLTRAVTFLAERFPDAR